MAKFFSIKNFESYQHYKHRNPPWIKLHADILKDYDFCQLPDASKAHLLVIGLLASRYDNKIPNDVSWIGKQMGANSKVDLEPLIAAGFIILNDDASAALASCTQNPRPEIESEIEIEIEKKEVVELDRIREKRERAKARTRIGNFMPSVDQKQEALEHWRAADRSDLDAEAEAQRFFDSHLAKGSAMADWPAAWRTWYRNAPKFTRQENGRKSGSNHTNHLEGIRLLREEIAARRTQTGTSG